MKNAIPITKLFLDIGGVLVTDGWDHDARKRGVAKFKLKFTRVEERHLLNFDTYEAGKLQVHLRKAGLIRVGK